MPQQKVMYIFILYILKEIINWKKDGIIVLTLSLTNKAYLWHMQLGHNNKIKLKDIQNVCKLGIDPFNASKISLCKCCPKGKQHRSKPPKVEAIQERCIHIWINH